MIDTLNFTPLQILSIKDISNLMGVSERTAKHYAKDIKTEFNLTKITFTHLKMYFKI